MAVGKIVATVIVNTSVFIEGLKKAGKRAQKFGKTVRKGSNKALKEFEERAAKAAKSVPAAMAKAAAAPGAAGAAIFTALVVKGLAAVDAQAKMARTLGATQAGLVGLERAAADAGVEQGVVADEVTKLTEKLGEAMIGTGTAVEALDRLNLSAETLSKMDVDERMAAISDAMTEGGLSTAQMAFELGELGFSSELLIDLMKGGGDAIRGATKEMEAYGVAMSGVDSAEVENANKALGRAMEVVNGVANQMAVRLAPMITAVAELFTDASKESSGFGDILDATVRGAVGGIGFVVDALSTLRLGFLGIELAAESVASGVFVVMAAIGDRVSEALQTIVANTNEFIRAFNTVALIKLPEIDTSEFSVGFREFTDEAVAQTRQTRDSMNEILDAPLPSESLDLWVAQVRMKSLMAAEASVDAHKKQNEENAKLTTEAMRKEKEAAEKAAMQAVEAQQKAMATRFGLIKSGIQTVTDFIRTETEVEQAGHIERLKQLNDAHAFMLISDQDFMAARERLEEGHAKRLNDIEEAAQKKKMDFVIDSSAMIAGSVIGALKTITSGSEGESKKQFGIAQALALSEAVVNTAAGITKALAQGPTGIPQAIAIGIAGAAQIAAIKSQSFSKSATSAASAPSEAQGGSGGGGGTLTVQGLDRNAIFGGDQVAALAEDLLEFQREGGQVVLA